MSIERSIAIRFLQAKRRNSLVSLIALLAVAGIGLGVAALIVVSAVLDGFETNFKQKLLGLVPHVTVYRSGANISDWPTLTRIIQTVPGVRSAIPFIRGQVMITSGQGASGIVLIGLDPETSLAGGFWDNFVLTPFSAANLTQRPMISPSAVAAEEGVRPPESESLAPRATSSQSDVETPRPSSGALATKPQTEPQTELATERQAKLEPFVEPVRPLLVGRELAKNLGLEILTPVKLFSPFGSVTPLGQRVPKTQIYTVGGIFQANYYDFDAKFAFTTLTEAESILGFLPGEVSYVEVKVHDINQVEKIHEEIMDLLGPDYLGRDWRQQNLGLFSALKLEQTSMLVILVLIVLVAAFNISSTLIMMVTEKTKDIAILKAMGATSRQIGRIFTLQGLLVGGVGTVFGLVGGLILSFLLKQYEFISVPPEIYLINTLPVELRWRKILVMVVISMVISYLATVYPAKAAARFDPVEAIRYE